MPVMHICTIPRLDEGGWKVRILVDDGERMNLDLTLEQAAEFSDDLADQIERIRTAASAFERLER